MQKVGTQEGRNEKDIERIVKKVDGRKVIRDEYRTHGKLRRHQIASPGDRSIAELANKCFFSWLQSMPKCAYYLRHIIKRCMICLNISYVVRICVLSKSHRKTFVILKLDPFPH